MHASDKTTATDVLSAKRVLLDRLDGPRVAGVALLLVPEIATADPLIVSVVAFPRESVEDPAVMLTKMFAPEITMGVPLTVRVSAFPGGSVEDPTITSPPVLGREMTTGDSLIVRVTALPGARIEEPARGTKAGYEPG